MKVRVEDPWHAKAFAPRSCKGLIICINEVLGFLDFERIAMQR
jgi:hypothetical protein